MALGLSEPVRWSGDLVLPALGCSPGSLFPRQSCTVPPVLSLCGVGKAKLKVVELLLLFLLNLVLN